MPPATMAGVAALLEHWADVADEDTAGRDFDSTIDLLNILAKGVQAIDEAAKPR
jgi:hypothetical protein